jgi:AraC-like DNA-binding protein
VIALDQYDLRRGGRFGVHAHDAHQLTWASHGVLDAEICGARWVLASTSAMWIPAGLEHDIVASRSAHLHCAYFEPEGCPIRWTAPMVVVVSSLLRELLRHLGDEGAGARTRRQAELLVLDLVEPAGRVRQGLVMPRDERARRVAEALRDDPADPRGLAEWGRIVGASARTLVRLFAGETGMTFTDWRTHVRLQASLPLLAAGRPVGVVATTVGYSGASAYIAAFRRHFGDTPVAHRSGERASRPVGAGAGRAAPPPGGTTSASP